MSATCFHCGGEIPVDSQLTVDIRGEPRAVCCAGCRAVAALIEQQGLARFYAFRSVPNQKPGAADAALWRVCDRPEVARTLTRAVDADTAEFQCRVDGVTCAACTWLIDRGLRGVDGVREVSVNPITSEAVIRYDPSRVTLSGILAALSGFGFAPRVHAPRDSAANESTASRAELKRLAVAGLGAMQVMTLSAALYLGAFKNMDAVFESYFALVSMLIATPVVLYAGAPIFRAAWRDLSRRRLGMDVPVALALFAALGVSIANALRGSGHVYFDSAAMFLFFLTLGRFLEARARHRAAGVFSALADLKPLAATRKRGDRLEHIGAIELEVGDAVLVAPGETVPADGELLSPTGSFDEALLSGEFRGRERVAGDAVLGGSLNAGRAPVEVRVARLGNESYLERVGSLLARALADRPQFFELADRFAAMFVGALLVVTAVVGAVWWTVSPERAFEVVLALLVVTCPCALSLAAPTAYAVALGKLARQGLLLTSARVLERLKQVNLWIFDKTGTLTEGQLGVADVTSFGPIDREAALSIAASLEAGIEHPIARALRGAAAPRTLATDVEYHAGFGVTGRVAGRRYRLGSARHAGPAAAPEGRSHGVYLTDEDGLVARIELADRLRPQAKAAMDALAAYGEVALVSGDEAGVVAEVAARTGIDRHFAARTPGDKLELLRDAQRQGRVVAAVGDGINDAPLLAQADVSIAMQSGSELARAAADVVFTGDDLRVLARLPAEAATTRRIVRENLVWAALYNLVAVPLAAAGLLAPWMAAIGMSASSLVVVGNALRLSRMLGHADRTPARSSAHMAPALERETA